MKRFSIEANYFWCDFSYLPNMFSMIYVSITIKYFLTLKTFLCGWCRGGGKNGLSNNRQTNNLKCKLMQRNCALKSNILYQVETPFSCTCLHLNHKPVSAFWVYGYLNWGWVSQGVWERESSQCESKTTIQQMFEIEHYMSIMSSTLSFILCKMKFLEHFSCSVL